MIYNDNDCFPKLPWNKEAPEMYVFDNWGISVKDEIHKTMRSGKTLRYSILSFDPIYNGLLNGKRKQATRQIDKALLWRVKVKPEDYI